MPSRLRQALEKLISSLWFLPALLTLLSVLLAGAMLWLDMNQRGAEWVQDNAMLLSSTEGASRLLGTIAGSVISVAGVLFSITILVLSTASAQFGPRLIGNFMRHWATQMVLGTFVGVFTYCLIVLRFVGVKEGFVPHVATNIGLLLGLISFFLLIYFTHHVATFIQVANVIDDVSHRMERTLQALFPERSSGDDNTPDREQHSQRVADIDADSAAVPVETSGYLQLIEYESLLKQAQQKDVVIRLHYRPGHYMLRGTRLAGIAPADRLDDELVRCLHQCTVVGTERTLDQDAEFAVHQLVEIALRALSPGVNDPFTAINCVDRLGSALAMIASRELPSRYLEDDQHALRVIGTPLTYAGIVNAAFNQLRQNAEGNAAVVFRMLEVFAELASLDLPDPFRDTLDSEFSALKAQNADRFVTPGDQEEYKTRCEAAQRALVGA